MSQDPRPQFNRLLGWAFLIAGFAWAVELEPWSFSERDPALIVGSPQMRSRHAQAVVLAMGFLQFAVAMILQRVSLPAWPRRAVEWLTGAGALMYALGCATWPAATWTVAVGPLVSFAGLLLLMWMCLRGDAGSDTWNMIPILCFGMLLNTVMALFYLNPDLFLPAYLGPEDGVRQRMLRLARAAAIALPLVALLYKDLALRAGAQPIVRWAQLALWCGAFGMSAILTLASFTAIEVKFLLPIPALTTFMGSAVAVGLAWRQARFLESWGWLLAAASMGIGLFIGMYAFDGPLPAPGPLENYNNFVRRLSRLAHAYCIVLGLMSILIAREPSRDYALSWPARVGVPLFVAGSVATLLMILLLAGVELPLDLLRAGPVLVVVGAALCAAPIGRGSA